MTTRTLAAAAAMAVLGWNFGANAADTPAVVAERIEVTGSRLPISDEQSASPVATFRAEDIALDGYPSIELFLNTLPQVFMNQGSRIANGASGTSAVDLRGLGAHRTLVLVNGRRLPAGSPTFLPPDLNQIPIPLVRRVEVLTGGASAVYGSDAMTGVVNFIMDDRFQGVHGEVGHDFYNHQQDSFVQDALRARNFAIPGDKSHDGASTRASLALGGDFAGGRGNASVFFGYVETEELLHADRDYSACALNALMQCGGVATGYPGVVADLRSNRNWTMAQDGSVRLFSPATDLYNFAPLNHFQRPNERYHAAAFARYELSRSATAYAEFSFHDDHTAAQIAPTAVFGNVAVVRYDNPLLSDDWRSRLAFRGSDGMPSTDPGATALVSVLRRNVEGGPREADLRHTSFREVVGMKGALGDAWDYDAFYQVGKVIYEQTYRREFSNSRIGRVLDVVPHPDTGAAVCASVLDGSDPACVPYNFWSLGGVTSEALDYLQLTAVQTGFTSQRLGGATLKGQLDAIRLPGSSQGIGIVLGIESRKEELRLDPDSAFSTGDLAGQGGATLPVAGSVDVKEVFGEARAPIGERSSLSASYRYSDYGTGFSTNTYGIGANWSPVPWLRVRGAYQNAIRAPNIVELFAPQATGIGVGVDPCAGESPARSLEHCARTGVTAQRYGHIPQIPAGLGAIGIFGGNPLLQPEEGVSKTLGIALELGRRSTATIDYFDIRLDDSIGFVFTEISLIECLNSGDPIFCGAIRRDPATGALWFGEASILAINRNLLSERVRGVDVGISHAAPIGDLGSLSLDAIGTYLRERSIEPYPGPGPYDCAGLYGRGCGAPSPDWRHRIRLTWSSPWNFDAALTWRHIGSTKDSGTSRHLLLTLPASQIGPGLKAMSYVDLAVAWQATRHLTLRAGINNVADVDPPVSNRSTNANTYSHTYDALGRHVFATLTARF